MTNIGAPIEADISKCIGAEISSSSLLPVAVCFRRVLEFFFFPGARSAPRRHSTRRRLALAAMFGPKSGPPPPVPPKRRGAPPRGRRKPNADEVERARRQRELDELGAFEKRAGVVADGRNF